MKTILNRIHYRVVVALAFLFVLTGCSKDDPQKEDTPELITKVTLTFTPTGGGAAVVATATDPDGDGVQEIAIDGPIDLAVNTQYVLTIELINGLVAVGEPGYNITEEVEEEGDEHMFFFGWTGAIFQAPTGNGNIDNRADDVSYGDLDAGGLPIGLLSTWTTETTGGSGTFSVLLKHQPDLKTATSASTVGETDLDLEFTLNVQ